MKIQRVVKRLGRVVNTGNYSSIRVENEIEALIDSGHEVHILCFGKEKALEYEQYKGAVIHRIKPGRVIIKSSVAALSLPIYFKYWNRQLKKILNDYHFDVVHVHDLPLIKPAFDFEKFPICHLPGVLPFLLLEPSHLVRRPCPCR